mgnify:CR=1 FL=1
MRDNLLQKSVLLILSIISIVVYFVVGVGEPNRLVLSYSFFVVIICIVIMFHAQQHSVMKGNWAKPSNIFLLAAIVVFYQYLLDYYLGIKTSADFYNEKILNCCALISNVGITGFTLGYINRDPSIPQNKATTDHYSKNTPWPLIIIQIIVFILFLREVGIGNMLSGADFGSDFVKGSSNAGYYEYLLQSVNVAILIYSIKSHPRVNSLREFIGIIPPISAILIAVYILLRIPSGDRGPFIVTLFALFYAYLYSSKKAVRLWILLVALLVGAYSVSLIGMARQYDLSSSFSDRMSDASSTFRTGGRFSTSRSFFAPTQELAFSFTAYQCMVSGIEDKGDDYRYGKYQAVEIMNSVPFGPSFVQHTLGITGPESASGTYATYEYLGPNPSWGLGSCIIGDFYMDFGIIGVFLCMLLVGLAYRRIDSYLFLSQAASNAVLAFVFIYATRAINVARGTFLGELRGVILIIIVLYFNSLLLNEKTK